MYGDRHAQRAFFNAPQSVTTLLAAFLEPAVIVAAYLGLAWFFDEPLGRPDMVLCLLIFALTFPGRDRFGDGALNAAVDIGLSWLSLLAILLLCGWASRSLGLFSWPTMTTWAVATPATLWLVFLGGRTWLRYRAGLPGRRRIAVVVGAGPLGAKVAQTFRQRGDLALDFLGYFDDRNDDRLDPQARALRLGGLADLAAFIGQRNVHEVYITLPLGSQPRIVRLLEQVQGTTASIYFVPDVFAISIIQGRLLDVNGIPVVGLCETPFRGANEFIKRASDIVLASLILLLISPLLPVLAIGVKLSSPGPVIFKQRRNGLDGEEIVVWKFRSMRSMDDGAVVKQATRDDDRITRFGAFLRRTSLDELPQFLNVLQGRMSVVGPRPQAVTHNEQYRQLISAYMVRHKVRPGITGWAQINGHRGETDTVDKMKARVEYDLEYLRNWSLGLDLQIIARTVKLMFFDRHAY